MEVIKISHFNVLVIGENPDAELLPYDEEYVYLNQGREDDVKWDWYVIGGRWTGFFKLKKGAEGRKGKPTFGIESAKEGYADQARLKDIDIEGMREEAAEKAREEYRAIREAFGGEIPKLEKTWQQFLEEKQETKEHIDETRKKYHAQPAMRQLAEVKKKLREEYKKTKLKGIAYEQIMPRLFFQLEDYQCTEEEYVERAKKRCIRTFAVVKDGKWYEKGEMLWWAMVANEKDEDEWDKEFFELFETIPEDALLTLVDCHI